MGPLIKLRSWNLVPSLHGKWWRIIDGETVETVSDFIFLDSKITADGDCRKKLKDAYFLEGKLCVGLIPGSGRSL